MQIRISGNQFHVLDFEQNETVSEIKDKIAILEQVNAAEFILSCEGTLIKSNNNSVVEPPKKKMRAHTGLDCFDAPPIIGRP